jgi:hypothetical protein
MLLSFSKRKAVATCLSQKRCHYNSCSNSTYSYSIVAYIIVGVSLGRGVEEGEGEAIDNGYEKGAVVGVGEGVVIN